MPHAEILKRLFSRDPPLILQSEAGECGLACVAMVAGYHGLEVDLPMLRSTYLISMKGGNLNDLISISQGLHLHTRPLRVELDGLSELPTPCILHWDFNHFVVLVKCQGSRIVVADPALGFRSFELSEAGRHFTGIALELWPAVEFRPKKVSHGLTLSTLIGRAVGLRRSMGFIIGLAVCLEVFGLALPWISQLVIDEALVFADSDLLTILIVGLLVISGLRAATEALRAFVTMHLTASLNVQWTANFTSHLFRLPMEWFRKRHIGDVMSRLGGLTAIQHFLSESSVTAVIDGAMALGLLIVMSFYSVNLTLIVLGAVAVYAAIRIWKYRVLREETYSQIVRAARQQTYLMESIRGMQAIKLQNGELARVQRLLNLLVDTTRSSLAIQRQTIIYATANASIAALETAALLYLAATLVLGSSFTVGMLIAFLAFKDQFFRRVTSFVDTALSYRMLFLQVDRLADIACEPPEEIDEHVQRQEISEASLELRRVCFRYDTADPQVLSNVTLSIAQGECVAITGPSGCGKSTSMKIMVGLLKPDVGDVLIGGVPIARLGRRAYRSMIGVVMQDDQLFAGTIGQNISFFDDQATDDQVREAARLANIHDDIASMPMQYNTLVGDMGAALSGGQRQRVLLARALYRKPRFLFLDEATSTLDVQSERTVNDAIRKLRITRIVIAHRPQTISMADRIIHLPDLQVQKLLTQEVDDSQPVWVS